MRQFLAFSRKEWMEAVRTGKLFLLMLLFIFFGIMSPAMAKLTPWMMKMMEEDLAQMGLIVTEVKVDALTSWTQFYKNTPIALIIFFLFFSSILTLEYQKGTLVNMITKGLVRWKIILAKTLMMTVVWTAGYWICYGITYGYSAYFWDNHILKEVLFPAFCLYVTGLWLISLLILMSVLFDSNTAVIVGGGGCFLFVYLAGMFQKVKKYLPAKLWESAALMEGVTKTEDYRIALAVTLAWIVVNLVLAVVLFNKKSVLIKD